MGKMIVRLEVKKNPIRTSFWQELRASTDATDAQVNKLAEQASYDTDLEGKFQKERLS